MGERYILGLWAGNGGEGAYFWLSVLTEIKNRAVEDVCITVCDGLKSLPEAITIVWEFAVVQDLHHAPDPSIWPPGHWTGPTKAGHDGPQGGSRH